MGQSLQNFLLLSVMIISLDRTIVIAAHIEVPEMIHGGYCRVQQRLYQSLLAIRGY